MPHPHILQKSLVDITSTTRALIENLYRQNFPAISDDVWHARYTVRGMLMLWSELCFDMGVTPHINVAEQGELEALAKRLDAAARTRLDMPAIQD